MKKLVKYVIFIIIGVLVLALGAYALSLGHKGPGDLDLVTGSLELVGSAYDPDFDIEVESPFLQRRVEMYQYYEDERGNIKTNFFSTQQSVPQGDREVEYKNPSFPESIKGKTFYGDVVIGQDRVHLADEFLDKFSLDSYVDFSQENLHYQVVGLDSGEEVAGLHEESGEYYTDSVGPDWEVGDILVYWVAMDPADFASFYTAAGQLEGDTLQVKDGASVFFYDRELSDKEIEEEYKQGNNIAGIVFMAIGVGLIAFAALNLSKSKKQDQDQE